jgi:antitoxin (DNA-binding transcriptional repressor) of toxin-antitoxin stability system
MTTITLTEAQTTLSELIHRLTPGEEVVITENDRNVAKLIVMPPTSEPRKIPQLGTLRGTVLSMEHFDDPLEDFSEYMR